MEAPSKNTTDSKKYSYTHTNIINNILMISLNKFYENTENLEKIKKIINGESNISLRIMDWFVTNYSKKNNICYITYTKTKTLKKFHKCNDESREETPFKPKQKKVQFNVYVRYKAQLKSYSKKNFDPFCRKDRITDWGPDGDITTTMGQLNFFKWAIQNDVLDYIQENLADIEKDMNSNTRKKKTKIKNKDMNEKKTEKVKRTQLSYNATKVISKMNNETIVEFD